MLEGVAEEPNKKSALKRKLKSEREQLSVGHHTLLCVKASRTPQRKLCTRLEECVSKRKKTAEKQKKDAMKVEELLSKKTGLPISTRRRNGEGVREHGAIVNTAIAIGCAEKQK